MRRLLREAIEAGAFGFTTTTSPNHVGYGARPLAWRNASRFPTHHIGAGVDRKTGSVRENDFAAIGDFFRIYCTMPGLQTRSIPGSARPGFAAPINRNPREHGLLHSESLARESHSKNKGKKQISHGC